MFRISPKVDPLEPKFDNDQIKLLLNEHQIHAPEVFWVDKTCQANKLVRLRPVFKSMFL